MGDLFLLPLRALTWLVARLPLPVVRGLGSLLGWIWFWIVPIRRAVVLENLARALPDRPRAERRRIAAATFRHVAVTVLELFKTVELAPRALESLIEVEGFERYLALRDAGRGVIAVTAHIGNFDLLACSQAAAGVPLSVVTKDLSARGLSARWMEARRRAGVRLLPAKGSALSIVRALRRAEVVGLIVDQRTPAQEGGARVPFFGEPAWTTTAPHRLAERTGAALLPVWSRRLDDGRHRVVIEPEIALGSTPEETMAAIHRRLESWIRDCPEQYLWLHRRWRP